MLLVDTVTGDRLLTEAEANKVSAEEERLRAEEERLRAEEARLLAEEEKMRADKERNRADFERDRADAELSARLTAERRVQDLEDQLKRLGERNRPN